MLHFCVAMWLYSQDSWQTYWSLPLRQTIKLLLPSTTHLNNNNTPIITHILVFFLWAQFMSKTSKQLEVDASVCKTIQWTTVQSGQGSSPEARNPVTKKDLPVTMHCQIKLMIKNKLVHPLLKTRPSRTWTSGDVHVLQRLLKSREMSLEFWYWQRNVKSPQLAVCYKRIRLFCGFNPNRAAAFSLLDVSPHFVRLASTDYSFSGSSDQDQLNILFLLRWFLFSLQWFRFSAAQVISLERRRFLNMRVTIATAAKMLQQLSFPEARLMPGLTAQKSDLKRGLLILIVRRNIHIETKLQRWAEITRKQDQAAERDFCQKKKIFFFRIDLYRSSAEKTSSFFNYFF